MKILVLLISVSILSTSCLDAQKEEKKILDKNAALQTSDMSNLLVNNETDIDSLACGLNFIPSANYLATKQHVEVMRKRLSNRYKTAQNKHTKDSILNNAMHYFTKAILNNIIPHWYGTEWDFNGHTNTPGKGEVACGYFVSTTLKHAGVQLNRFKLAQQASKLEVASIAITPKNIVYASQKKIEDTLSKLSDGLYIVGLDNHVGYVYKHKEISYFIHSSYITDRVMIEFTEASEAFPSEVYYLAPVANKQFIKKWLLNEVVVIKTS